MLLGAHVSVAGGLENGPVNGAAIRAEAIQIFTRNQRTWRHKPLTDEEVAAFRAARDAAGLQAVVSHASYLLNLAAVDGTTRKRSLAALAEELVRCSRLGVEALVLHPGAHGGRGEAVGIRAIAAGLDHALDAADGAAGVTLALETTAGQGHSIGHRFEHLRDIMARVAEPHRHAVCVDTCHVFAAGYDLRAVSCYDAAWQAFDAVIGLDRLAVLHLNDSLRPFASRRDRHADIGEGELGLAVFTRMARDSRFSGLPAVFETPGAMAGWKRDIARLKRARSR